MADSKPSTASRIARSTSVQERKSKSRDSSKCPSPKKSVEKKLPPIKAPVGLAKGPDLKNVRSKIGSFQNLKHQPAGGEKKMMTQKLEWKAASKIGSLDYAKHKPGGGDVKVETRKLDWKVNSKIGSLDNVKHKPGGGAIKIFNERYVGGRSCSEVRSSSTSVRSPSPTQPSNNSSGHTSRKASTDATKGLTSPPTKKEASPIAIKSPPQSKLNNKQLSSSASTPSPVNSSRNSSRPSSAKPSSASKISNQTTRAEQKNVESKPISTNQTTDLLGNVQNQLNQLILDQPIQNSISKPIQQQDLLA